MRHIIERISDGTWRAYAQARALHSATGTWPRAATLARLAVDAEGDPWALLVLTRGELPSRAEPSVCIPAFTRDHVMCERPDLVVPTVEALWAVSLGEERLYARLCDVDDRRIKPRDLARQAARWERDEQLPGVVTAAPVIEVALPAEAPTRDCPWPT
jgi:hypothetical protein